jgi:opacity protein-like surface antigen
MKNVFVHSVLRVLLAVVLSTCAFCGYAEKGDRAFGVKLGYAARNNSAVGGAFFQYSFSDHFRLQPAAEYVFRHNGRDASVFEVDAHFPINLSTSKWSFYPIVGVNAWIINNQLVEDGYVSQDDVSTRETKFGLNCGAGLDLKVNSTMKVNFEARYVLIKHIPTALVTVGLAYVF